MEGLKGSLGLLASLILILVGFVMFYDAKDAQSLVIGGVLVVLAIYTAAQSVQAITGTAKTKKCPACREPVALDARRCPHCTEVIG